MGNKLKAISKVSVALALLGAAVPAVEAAPTAMAAKKATKKAKKSTKKVVKKSTKKAKKAKKTTKKKATKKVAKKTAAKKPAKKSTPKKNTKKVTKKSTKKTVKKTVKKATPASTNLTFYNSKGKPTSYWPAKNGLEKAPKKGDKVVVLGQGIINGQLMYKIAQDSSVYLQTINGQSMPETAQDSSVYVPAKDVKVDYFKNVHYIDYYLGSGTPAQIKAKYDANLAEVENSYPEDGIDYWFDAHPLERLREGSKDTVVSKSTYEKHNFTYAQRAATVGRMSPGYTKESYTAYIKGEKAYRQYEAKWAAEHPNITRYMEELFKNDSDYKKYNLNTFEWHYNDNFFINIRK